MLRLLVEMRESTVTKHYSFVLFCSSIARIFILPRPNPPQTLVAISLDHPIRKGQTSYNHIICQFPSDQDISLGLDISDEALAAKNEKCGGYLLREMKGNAHEVFTKCLKGLSGAKVQTSCY